MCGACRIVREKSRIGDSRSRHGHSGREPFPDSGAVHGADQSGADYHGEDERRDAGRSVESDENLDSALRPDKGGSRPRGDLHARGRVSERVCREQSAAVPGGLFRGFPLGRLRLQRPGDPCQVPVERHAFRVRRAPDRARLDQGGPSRSRGV